MYVAFSSAGQQIFQSSRERDPIGCGSGRLGNVAKMGPSSQAMSTTAPRSRTNLEWDA